MGIYRLVPLQVVPQPSRKRLCAYLLGGGHTGALDQRHGGPNDPGQQADSGRIAWSEMRRGPRASPPGAIPPRGAEPTGVPPAKAGSRLWRTPRQSTHGPGLPAEPRAATGRWEYRTLSVRPGRQREAPWPAAAAPRPGREHTSRAVARRLRRKARLAPGRGRGPRQIPPAPGRAVVHEAGPGRGRPASGQRRRRSHRVPLGRRPRMPRRRPRSPDPAPACPDGCPADKTARGQTAGPSVPAMAAPRGEPFESLQPPWSADRRPRGQTGSVVFSCVRVSFPPTLTAVPRKASRRRR
jgi:hypothetical protein